MFKIKKEEEEILAGCLVCATTEPLQKKALELEDYASSKEVFYLSACNTCGALLTDPRPKAAVIGRYYDFPEYISHEDNYPGIVNRLYRLARQWTTARKLALLRNFQPDNNSALALLDYGCGSGYFLQAAKKTGLEVAGVEVSTKARDAAQQRVGVTIASSLSKLPDSAKYDFITLWHVLEHIHELDETLKQLFDRLVTGGTMFIAVPNRQSLDAETYGSYWASYDVPRHLYHFTPEAIEMLLQRHNSIVVNRIGQSLDGFYVSILSEKYKKGNILKGFLNGGRSLLNAWRNGRYSSIIYVVKKKSGE